MKDTCHCTLGLIINPFIIPRMLHFFENCLVFPSCLQCAPSEVGLNSEPNPHWNQCPFHLVSEGLQPFMEQSTQWTGPHGVDHMIYRI